MANISVTYAFVNGQASDGPQVSQNFTDLINGTSDGTKDLNINALTCAGTLTASASVVLGASSSDLLTVNSTPTIKAAFTVKGNGSTAGFTVSSANLVTIGVSGGTTNHVINGQLTQTSTNSTALSLTCSNNEIISKFTGNDTGSASTPQVEWHAYMSTQKIGGIQFFNTSATPSSSGGVLKIFTNDGSGTFTSGIQMDSAGLVTIGSGTATQQALNTLLATNGAQVATLTNLPAAASSGNPAVWIKITLNGTTTYLPGWH